eukprot:TRINITY_DN2247_c0_g2_i1.p1 TRINITY_DN2247_c0_g2~~TRINITY_DN2247_c0_g2_i1.p1  ORF type:complete len:176 (+),score=35.83 TRINITY_DN2247_c0_g2_i1:66-530(+)
MSLLAAATRQASKAHVRAPAVRLGRRYLGDTVVGPPLTDIQANLKCAKNFFTKSAMSYGEYKQNCVSLRIFAFAGVTAGCVLSLMLDPPKSSYWVRYSPMYGIISIKNAFIGSSPPLFLTKKVERETDVPDIASQLINTRRLVGGAGSDSEEEH